MRWVIALVLLIGGRSYAQAPSDIQIHGFVSEGAFVSTANDYIGASSRGSLELFEAGLNLSTEVADRLRVGIQLFGRDEGQFTDAPGFDWAYLDYRYKPWLGIRAGVIKMPFGLYNEYNDIDQARTAILLPQSVYPLRDRTALLSQTGFELYGHLPITTAGALDYQAWLGTLNVPANALDLAGATLDDIDTKYVTGAQLFWQTPLDGLRVGASYVRLSIDFHVTLDAANTAALIGAGLEPAGFDGSAVVAQHPAQLWVASAEYTHDDWLFAAEYARTYTRTVSTLPEAVFPPSDVDTERFYVMGTHRLSRCWEVGAYYSAFYLDPNDRHGDNNAKFPLGYDAFQKDLAATVRFDVNEHWLWKLEAHGIDGIADVLPAPSNPTRRWGLFLLRTTVTF